MGQQSFIVKLFRGVGSVCLSGKPTETPRLRFEELAALCLILREKRFPRNRLAADLDDLDQAQGVAIDSKR